MQITVIIPVYNAANFLQKAVTSALIQPEVAEVLLIDDGSSDESLSICRSLAAINPIITVLSHADNQNRGVGATRNIGILHAKYNFIAFLDADDYYLPNRFNKSKEILLSQKDVDGVYENIGLEKNYKSSSKLFSNIEIVKHEELFESLQPLGNKVWFSSNGLLVRKSIFEKIGFFEESLKTSEDTHMWFKMAAKAKLVPGKINAAVAMSSNNPNSLTKNHDKVKKDYTKMLLKLFVWCNKARVQYKYRELVLNNLLFHVFQINCNNNLQATFIKLQYLIVALTQNPRYILFKSQVFRRYCGALIGYNKIMYSFNRSLR